MRAEYNPDHPDPSHHWAEASFQARKAQQHLRSAGRSLLIVLVGQVLLLAALIVKAVQS